MSVRPIGILGGTFDPVHHGHLRLALEMREAFDLDHVRLVPAAQTNLRRPPAASAARRLAMLELAVNGGGLLVDDREIRRGGVSYTVDTLADLRAELGATPLCLILGQDAFNALDRWHRWREIPQLAHLLVAARPEVAAPAGELGAMLGAASGGERAQLCETAAGCVMHHAIPPLAVSATAIRERIAAGRSIAYLTPPEVERFIAREGLYRT